MDEKSLLPALWSDIISDITSVHDSNRDILPMSWYEIVMDSRIEQGDVFKDCQVVMPAYGCPFPRPKGNVPTIAAIVNIYDVVVLSQSCDLEQGKISHALVCPYSPISDLQKIVARTLNPKELKNAKKNIKEGKEHGFHMLDRCSLPSFEFEPQVVGFRTVFSVPVVYLSTLASSGSERLRLRSPYKEHLSQAFARFFMRVGLPQDIKID
ncbi:hypothetical protein IAD21_01233 [Abditibacteriota bacterium]|nr:hypothetical protein IAD21_01233 [Abditibacteriota bacterium]